jgi:glutamate/gamma-aminobutyrate anti-porter
LIIGALVVVIAPFIIYAAKKPSWADPNSTFEPFHWETQAKPQVAPATATTAGPATSSTTTVGSTTSAPSTGSGSVSSDKDTPQKQS